MSEELIYEDGDFDVFEDDQGAVVLYFKDAEHGISWETSDDAIAALTQLLVGIQEAS